MVQGAWSRGNQGVSGMWLANKPRELHLSRHLACAQAITLLLLSEFTAAPPPVVVAE